MSIAIIRLSAGGGGGGGERDHSKLDLQEGSLIQKSGKYVAKDLKTP